MQKYCTLSLFTSLMYKIILILRVFGLLFVKLKKDTYWIFQKLFDFDDIFHSQQDHFDVNFIFQMDLFDLDDRPKSSIVICIQSEFHQFCMINGNESKFNRIDSNDHHQSYARRRTNKTTHKTLKIKEILSKRFLIDS